jgi:hypothetical protein
VRRPGHIRRWDVGRRFGTGLVGLPKTRGRHRILVEVGELEVARSRLITLGGAATVTKSPSWRMVLKCSRRRAGSGRLLGWREVLDECLGERLGMSQRGGVRGAGELVDASVGDVFRDVLGAGGEEGLGVRSLQHQHGR